MLTETTRTFASNTGPASGSSTRQNRDQRELPCAVADSNTSASTDLNPSAAPRTMIATA